MNIFRQVMRHPAGKIGLIVGLVIGIVVALMGETRKGLLFVGLCQLIAKRIGR